MPSSGTEAPENRPNENFLGGLFGPATCPAQMVLDALVLIVSFRVNFFLFNPSFKLKYLDFWLKLKENMSL